MLIIRLIFILLVITALVLLGLYLFLDDKKYLDYFKKTVKYALYLVVIVAMMFVLRRVLYF
ncbi:MAG TPA: hypothetical protein VK967_04485 [Methylotenera sp.]|nr:hypothetical protein [Methylotenera sp.]